MLAFHQVVKTEFEEVNQLIINQLHSDVGLVENIGQYIVDAGGKRLRPLLVLLASKACDYEGSQNRDLAAIIEFIHTATLLHDDVVDTSDLRRGRATANAKWGNAPSVLVGDFLYSRAFQMLVSIGSMPIMEIIADATNTISEGEVQQLINAGNPDTSEESYNEVIYKKTARLFEAASHAGAILADTTVQQQDQLRRYGYHLGMAFQLMDDVLDYRGNTEEMGKNIGDDLSEGKPTLPLIYVMKNGKNSDATLIQDAIKQCRTDRLAEIIDILTTSGALDYTTECARQHADKAADCLSLLPDSAYRQAMVDLAHFATSRNH
ncbi:MAG: polyprenyl synthetase family protein [Porticoccaceae bacterium]|nr:polyprenyl synthetase family protein [Pseudomonadales bacterium]MCP5172522.1 polyprenyl synthetase family protein [Pseudomonadales bacterium]